MAKKEWKEFKKNELVRKLPPSQRGHSNIFLSRDENSCMICGDHDAQQILMNGLPAQLCDDCIEIQKKKHGSMVEKI